MASQQQMNIIASLIMMVVVAISANCQDYESDGETALTGLAGLGIGTGSITGYAPMSASEVSNLAQAGSSNSASGSDSDNSDVGDYEDDSDSAAASEVHPILAKVISLISGGRHRRSIEQQSPSIGDLSEQESKVRVKRGSKGWVPYVSTYVKTDKKANFKWGVKAKIGKKYGR